jgi:hypothetical protein
MGRTAAAAAAGSHLGAKSPLHKSRAAPCSRLYSNSKQGKRHQNHSDFPPNQSHHPEDEQARHRR